MVVAVRVCFFGDRQSLLQKPLKERRRLLRSTFKEVDGRFRFATFMDHKVRTSKSREIGGVFVQHSLQCDHYYL